MLNMSEVYCRQRYERFTAGREKKNNMHEKERKKEKNKERKKEIKLYGAG